MADSTKAAPAKDGWPPPAIAGPTRPSIPALPGPRRTIHKPLGRRVKTATQEDV